MKEHILIFCDLDNTILYSSKKKLAGDICVEWKLSKKQGFMSREILDLLFSIEYRKYDNVKFIPVTSRSIEQYNRVARLSGLFEYAITTNGANLCKNGVQDADWWLDTYKSVSNVLSDIMSAYKYLNNTLPDSTKVCRIVDGFWTYASVNAELLKKNVIEHIESYNDVFELSNDIQVFDTGSKISVIPTAISKGNAVKRFIQDYKLQHPDISVKTLAFGDNLLDVSMLEAVDEAYTLESLRDKVSGGNVTFVDNSKRFDAFILNKLKEELAGKIANI